MGSTLGLRPLSLLVWWLKGGARRLKAARIRRGGEHIKAVYYLGGADVIIEAIKTIPDPFERHEYYKHLSRWMTSPNRK